MNNQEENLIPNAYHILASDFEEEEITDLFQVEYEFLPKELVDIISKYYELFESSDSCRYVLCREMLKETELIGYTFDYGLSGEPYDLRLKD